MPKTPAELPDSIEDLRALVLLQQDQLVERDEQIVEREEEIAKHEQTVSEYSEEISQLREYIRLMKSQRFGPRSERSLASQPGLFNEAEATLDEEGDEAAAPSIDVPAHTRRKRGGRRPLPAFLPREEVVHDLSDDEKVCASHADHTLPRIGEERLEQLVFIPATAKVLVHLRPKYACSICKDGVKTAPPPPSPIPKSLATPSLLAQIVTAKYVDGLPLHRQEQIFHRIGVDLSRATMASWVIRMGERVTPLLDLVLELIRGGDHVLADETPFQVLKEKGKRATSDSYLWALRGGDPDHPLLYYAYAPTRSGDVAEALLEGFEGYLQTDGYKGYDRFDAKAEVVHVGCFAHARRKFDEAQRGQGKGSRKAKRGSKSSVKTSLAQQGLSRINELYRIERSYAQDSIEKRSLLRKEKLAPRLEALREWTLASKNRVPPQSLTGKALGYLDSQWSKLIRVLDDARLPLDTNAVERAIRPFVIGRRNWLFADTPSGATASARLYSLVETAKANGVEPWAYLEAVFEALPYAESRADFEVLLPWRVELTDTAHRVAQR